MWDPLSDKIGSESRGSGGQCVSIKTWLTCSWNRGYALAKTNPSLKNRYQVSLNSLSYAQRINLLLRSVMGSLFNAPGVLS